MLEMAPSTTPNALTTPTLDAATQLAGVAKKIRVGVVALGTFDMIPRSKSNTELRMVTTHISGSAFDDGVLVEGVGEQLMGTHVGNPACLTKAARGELLYLYLYDLVTFSNTTAAPTLARLVVDS